MKKSFLFSINLLYIFHLITLIRIISVFNINQRELSVFFWIIVILSLITYCVFLRGLNYLRKTAKFLLSRKPFSQLIIENLKNSGKHFLITGIFSFLIITLIIIFDNKNLFKVVFDINIYAFLYFTIPLFIIIIGVFFLIQGKMLLLAKDIKNETELTI